MELKGETVHIETFKMNQKYVYPPCLSLKKPGDGFRRWIVQVLDSEGMSNRHEHFCGNICRTTPYVGGGN